MAFRAVPHSRDRLVTYHSPALEGNPLGASAERALRVYLPQGYESGNDRYPVIYLLHGYGGDADHPIVDGRRRLGSSELRGTRRVRVCRAGQTICERLVDPRIEHELHIFRDDTAARISASAVGIALQVEEGLRFCTDRVIRST